MQDKLNIALIEAIHSHTPQHANPATLLMEWLNLGREAAYRRLRGEVLFTFEEAAALGEKLQFSLDQLLSASNDGNFTFKLQFVNFQSPLETYQQVLESDAQLVRGLSGDPTIFYAAAGNAIPPEVYLKFPHLADFKLFKWLYQHDLCDPDLKTYEDLVIPQSLRKACNDFSAAAQTIPSTHYVFDNTIYMQWINAIRTFRNMHLISKESMQVLRDEMSLMIDEMKEVTAAGAYRNGNSVQIYLSDVDLPQSCCYMSARGYRATRIGLFALNSLRSTHPMMCDYVLRWIQTQGRFSTLASCSGEVHRINYLKRQRDALSMLD